MNKLDVLDKYTTFLKKKKLEEDPLVRFCTKPGCDGFMRAPNFKAKKLTCPKCRTHVCFKCRDEWHDHCTSCQKVISLLTRVRTWSGSSRIGLKAMGRFGFVLNAGLELKRETGATI